MKCVYCGKELEPDAKFCDGCGGKVEGSVTVAQSEANVVQDVSTCEVLNNEINNNAFQVPNKKSNKTIIIIVIVLLVLILGIVLAIVLSGGSKDSNSENNSSTNDATNTDNNTSNNADSNTNIGGNSGKSLQERADDVVKGFEEEIDCNLPQKGCLITIKNNTNEFGRAYISEIDFYNENNEYIGAQRGPLYFAFDDRGVSYTHIYSLDLFDGSNTFDHYEITYYIQNLSYEDHKDAITYTISKDDQNKEFVFNVTNNSDAIIDIFEIDMLFYKDDKLVGYTLNSSNENLAGDYIDYIKPHEEIRNIVRYPTIDYYSGDIIDYDRYEVIIEEAYTYLDARDLRYRNSHLRED